MTKPSRPILRWHGGKWRLAPWIIQHMPRHKVYVEPFGGAASVLLQKAPVPTEIWNDLEDGVVNLFTVIREDPEALAHALTLTPYSRAEYHRLYQPTKDRVEAARRFVARSFMGQSSKGALKKSGFDVRINPDGFTGRFNALRAIPAELAVMAARFSQVIIECLPALVMLDRYDRPDTLFYVDPPYLLETRHAAHYNHELTAADHEKLLAALRGLAGMVMLSGYPSPLYDGVLSDWRRLETDAHADGARERTEVLWLNPAAAAALDAERLPLFAEAS